MSNRRNSERGIALVAVLLLIGLLSVLALGVLETNRQRGRFVHRANQVAQMTEDADSAIRIILLQLTAPKAPSATIVAGAQSVEVFGRTVSLVVQLEAGRIDLNRSEASLLTAALAGNGYSQVEARRFAMRILDWRDPDDQPHTDGAEHGDYQRLGGATMPRNGPFRTVAELRQIPGLAAATAELLDAFTVYSQLSDVRQSAVSPAARRALQWAHEQRLEGRAWLSDSTAMGHMVSGDMIGEVVRLRACVRSQVNACRTAIVRLTGNRERPVMVYAWYTQYGEL